MIPTPFNTYIVFHNGKRYTRSCLTLRDAYNIGRMNPYTVSRVYILTNQGEEEEIWPLCTRLNPYSDLTYEI